MLRTIDRALHAVTIAYAVFAGLLVIVMMVHITTDVIARSFLNRPLPGTVAFVSHWYMVFVVCMPLAFVERKDQTITVDIVTDRFPARFRHHLINITFLVSSAVFGVVAYASWTEAVSKYKLGIFQIEENVPIPIWQGYFGVPLGFGLASLFLLLKFARYLVDPSAPLGPGDADGDTEPLGTLHD